MDFSVIIAFNNFFAYTQDSSIVIMLQIYIHRIKEDLNVKL